MLKPEHGGYVYDSKIEYDFSANLNLLGMPESVKNVLISSVDEWVKYPDPFCRSLTEKIALKEKTYSESIVCGNGAADLIYRIVYAVKPKNAVICTPTFSEYEKALNECGCMVKKHYLIPENNFGLDFQILDKLDDSIDIIFLCSPNNPTGVIIESSVLKMISEKCLEKNIILVCDECFLDLTENAESHSIKRFLNSNIIILKAFTKTYAMAGLRLGYAVFGDVEMAEKVRKIGQYWSVSAPAQIAGITALSEIDYIKKSVKEISKEREFLISELLKLGFTVYPSSTNFILFHCNVRLDDILKNEKILIRNCENYDGLEYGYFRIAVRTRTENEKLISAIRRNING